jgi:hypothetical protein
MATYHPFVWYDFPLTVPYVKDPVHKQHITAILRFSSTLLVVSYGRPFLLNHPTSTMNPARINLKRRRQMPKAQLLQILIVLSMLAAQSVTAWSPNQKPFGSRRNRQQVAPSTKQTKVAPKELLTTQKMLKSSSISTRRDSKMKLSNSVLASCDTLPSFPTAHGLLSPHTISRLEASIDNNDTVEEFLRTYRHSGPLSCVQFLSDPMVLPHLTRAMREIAA